MKLSMFKSFLTRGAGVIIILLSSELLMAKEPSELVKLEIEPGRIINNIDEKVYGHFLEHIYHSCDGGLWGELVWNRSFEENECGQWSLSNGIISQNGLGTNIRLTFGNSSWTDYEYTLQARKINGNEGFLILFRVKNQKDFYWCNLGGWSNDHHAIERGRSNENRWHTVGPAQKGSIRKNHWYNIKVRCEGLHFQVWLDSKQIIDFTDNDQGHKRGAVGIGTWSTKAAFRNLKVTDLEGRELFKGIPEVLGQPSTARHWQAYGTGSVYLSSGDALNCNYSQRIVGKTGETGIMQKAFNIKQSESYLGSLWIRSNSQDQSSRLVVRLKSGTGILDQVFLKPSSRNWKEKKFSLKPCKSCSEAILEIGLLGPGEVSIDQVSLMPESWAQNGGFRPDLLNAISELKPPIIRWPGGCFASAYRWKHGIGPQYKRIVHPLSIWDQKDVYSFGTDEFISMCRKVGAEPLIVVNIGTPNWVGKNREDEFLKDILDWLEYCNGPADSTWGKVRSENGHPKPYNVTYWEIDNETWSMGADAYSRAVRRVAKAMRAKTSFRIKLAACGSGGFNQAWNKIIIQKCADMIDYLSIHHYENPDAFEKGPLRYETFFRETFNEIKKSRNPGLKIDVSEWNAQSTDWRTGLYCGGLLNAFERCGDFLEIGGPALFLRHISATGWDNAFINFDNRSWFPAPNYVVMKLWHDHYSPLRIALKGNPGPLNMVATKNTAGDRIFCKVVNPSTNQVTAELTIKASVRPGSAILDLVSPGSLKARNTLEKPHAVWPKQTKLKFLKNVLRVDLPPLSAGVITIQY